MSPFFISPRDPFHGEVHHYTVSIGRGKNFSADPATSHALTKNSGRGDHVNTVAENPTRTCPNYSASTNGVDDYTLWTLMDINGDGLLDRLYTHDSVALNRGYGFQTKECWRVGDVGTGYSNTFSASVGIPFGGDKSYSGGVSGSLSMNRSEEMLTDLNGDGRLDRVVILPAQHKIRVFYNTGCGFNGFYDSLVVNGGELYRWTTTRSLNATFGSDIIPKYSFNAKELDEETGMYYYEARYYKPPVFTSRDPMFEKYFWMTPYAYCANNPVKYVDPDGREGITVSGSPGNHKNKRHFLENGLDRAKQAKTHFQRKGEVSTWIIYNDKINGYSSALINEYKKKAAKAGINVKVVSEVKEITDYVNNKNENNTREKDKITSFYYLGHATPGDLKVGYNGTGEDFDPSDFKAEAFSSGTFVDVVGGCRTAINWGVGLFDPSIIKQFSKILDKKSVIRGSDVRVQYNGGVMTDEQLVKENNGNIVIINGRLD